MNKWLSGDLVLADRGFTIVKSIMFQQAQLVIPAFTKVKDQLYPVDIEKLGGSQMLALMSKGLLVVSPIALDNVWNSGN